MTNSLRMVLLVLLFAPCSARAQAECPPDHVGCHLEDVEFFHRDALFDDVMFDTGWQPASSPVQVRFALYVGGSTEVEMGGTSITSWPPPLNESIVGRAETGRFSLNYGIEIIARLRFDVSVAGVRYRWEGDIPIPGGIPPDLRIADEIIFDPFVLLPSMPRPVSAMDSTDVVTILDVPLTSAFIPIPGISGGFAVDAFASLEGHYQTNDIEVNDAVGLIETEGGSVVVRADEGAAGLGAAKDLVITPHGTVTYEGVVTLRPLVYVEVAGRRFDLSIADVPVRIPPIGSNTDFTPAEVHVPLPDIRIDPTRVTFEDTPVGGADAQLLTIFNDGEAVLEVVLRDPATPFAVGTPMVSVPPSSSARVELTFEPSVAGMPSGVLFLASNDPDEPLVTVQLNGAASGGADGGVPGDAGLGGPIDGGCGCRTTSGSSELPGWLLGLVAIALSRASRRRRGCA